MWLNNPNVHLGIAVLCQLASFIPVTAPFAPILQTVGATLTTTGLIIPEQGSMHAKDYAAVLTNAAGEIIGATPTPKQ